MEEIEFLALSGLLHDLPILFDQGLPGQRISDWVQELLKPRAAHLKQILDEAEGLALPEGRAADWISRQPLRSIFSHVQLDPENEPKQAFHPFAALPATSQSLEKLFPVQTGDTAGMTSHLQHFLAEMEWLGKTIDKEQFEVFYSHLLAVLQRFGWCIPAHVQDVSLFDHARLTSAIAVCLQHFYQENPGAHQPADEIQPFCLVVGDLSGIQKYIFDITTTGAGGVARRLRSRSFFISALADVISHQIAFSFQVPLGNVLMSSGGKFYVLVPNRKSLEDDLQHLRKVIDGWFRREFNAEITLNLAWQTFAGAQFQASSLEKPGFGDVLTALSMKLSLEKQHRGLSVLTSEGSWSEPAFVIERDFGGSGVCESCRKFPATQAQNLCEQCEGDVQVGKKLPRIAYIAYFRQASNGKDVLPMPQGYAVRVLAKDELEEAAEAYLVVKPNDPDVHELAEVPAGFRYLANHIPAGEHGEPLSFEAIAEHCEGRHLLGYLKADVDNLGLLIGQGLRRDQNGWDTAAHLAALSREMDLFFSGWVQHTLSQVDDYTYFYTIFSGGDDLFLLGPWNKAADLALTLQERFAAFTGHNPDLTLSAGILFTKERYPIARAAEDAEKVLETAKEHPWEDEQGKKRSRAQLSLLGDTLRWQEAREIFAEIKTLAQHQGALKSAFLYHLIEYGQLYKLWAEEGKIEGLRYKPLFAYHIARNLRKGEPLRDWSDELLRSLHGGKKNNRMAHIGLIATCLLFARRTTENTKAGQE